MDQDATSMGELEYFLRYSDGQSSGKPVFYCADECAEGSYYFSYIDLEQERNDTNAKLVINGHVGTLTKGGFQI